MVDRSAGGGDGRGRARTCLLSTAAGVLLPRCQRRRKGTRVADPQRVSGGWACLVKYGKKTRYDPGSRWHVLREIFHNTMEPVIVKLILIKEQQHQQARQGLLIQHLLTALFSFAHPLRPSLTGAEMMVESTESAQVMMVVTLDYLLRAQIKYCVPIARWVPRWRLHVPCTGVIARLLENPLQNCVSLLQDLSSPRLPLLSQGTCLGCYFFREMCDDGVIDVCQDGPTQLRGQVVEERNVVDGS